MKFKKTSMILLIALSLCGTGIPTISANQTKITKQAKGQNNKKLIKNVKKQSNKNSNKIKHYNHPTYKDDWYRDGLSKKEYKARDWVVSHESGHHWNILSYGHICVGYFQLDPHYLGKKHDHVNLDHVHQVQVADHYAKARYHGWTHAKHWWQSHHWY